MFGCFPSSHRFGPGTAYLLSLTASVERLSSSLLSDYIIFGAWYIRCTETGAVINQSPVPFTASGTYGSYLVFISKPTCIYAKYIYIYKPISCDIGGGGNE